ncbi:MAG: helix-turn-helix transcriptional regulator, partial [Rubrivivax sp.]|nr:helix-turn-helix transcriptional regulator [Rubrivivax sp.]
MATARPRPPASAPAHEPRLARFAALVAAPTRARMLCFLLGGEYASAGELAAAGSVSAATASAHLARLLDAGLLALERRGRHRYYRLADAEVAHALEALALVAERGSHRQAWASPARSRLRHARCCFGHLAGELGVALLERLLARGWLAPVDGGYAPSTAGIQGLQSLGLAPEAWRGGNGSKPPGYPCLDWSERRDHLAGPLASALLSHGLAQGWLRRCSPARALELTPPG